jgi:hypothetical protein
MLLQDTWANVLDEHIHYKLDVSPLNNNALQYGHMLTEFSISLESGYKVPRS